MKPLEAYGYNAVGRGWLFILEALDSVIQNCIDHARQRIKSNPNSGGTAPSGIKIDQLKEKFGGLRVYITPMNMHRVLRAST